MTPMEEHDSIYLRTKPRDEYLHPRKRKQQEEGGEHSVIEELHLYLPPNSLSLGGLKKERCNRRDIYHVVTGRLEHLKERDHMDHTDVNIKLALKLTAYELILTMQTIAVYSGK
jgi:hypothetical protein